VFATTIPITFNLPVFSKNPGSVELTYPDGITGPASAPIAGTCDYRLDGRGGDYLAIPSFGQSRVDVTWLWTVDMDRTQLPFTGVLHMFPVFPIMGSYRLDLGERVNWQLGFRRYMSGANVTYGFIHGDSLDASSATALTGGLAFNLVSAIPLGVQRFALTKAAGGAMALHWNVRGPVATATRNSTGTMGGTEAMVMMAGINAAKILRIMSSAELDAWFSADTVPASDREFYYAGGHEIVSGSQKIYDTAGLNDLYAYQIPNRQAPGMSVRVVEAPGDPVIPWETVACVATASGTKQINGRRRRQGVPDRASDAEKWQLATATVVNGKVTVPMVFMD